MKTNIPSSISMMWLIVALTLAASPHFLYQPIWVSILFITGLAWRCCNIWFGLPLPKGKLDIARLVQLLLGLSAVVALFSTYGSTIGRDAGVGFLVSMLGLKVTEIKNQRDFYLTAFLGYFVVITNFFFTQSIPMLLLMFTITIVMTACLLSSNDQYPQSQIKNRLLYSSKMLVQALPVMLILFVLFPRIPGPIWGLPKDAHGSLKEDSSDTLLGISAQTGITNRMQLGNISRLIRSDKVAFRVQFEGEVPPSEQRYWRGPVLWMTDGEHWTEPNYDLIKSRPIIKFKDKTEQYRYHIVLEPHQRKWLFALDLPSELPSSIAASLSADAQLKSQDDINQRIRYSLTSNPHYRLSNTSATLFKLATALPEKKHRRTIELAQQWRSQLPDDDAYIERVLDFFREENFYYSLTPPTFSGDQIDGFLFRSRKGFCQHYAASFTVLMRAAGIPARVVTGYLGGEINPISGDLVVKQRDAHAWTEVWLSSKGWVRIDPTSAVSRERVESGINEIMPLAMRTPTIVAKSDRLAELWQHIENNWDAIDSKWNLWVLAYGPELQKELLRNLGMTNPNWQKMTIWLGLMIASVFIILPLILFYQRQKLDHVSQLYRSFCRKLDRHDLQRKPNEGPLDFEQRVRQKLPAYADQVSEITRLYINLKYGHATASIVQLERAVKAFKG